MPHPKLQTASLPDLRPAPELNNKVWLNMDSSLHLADLRGKVVGLEMWTFDCINCQRVMPFSKRWYTAYKGQEADLTNLKNAVAQDQIEYPVAQDNEGETWNSYHNMYWPTLYLIDKRGHIRYVHIGEGAYDEIETNIKTLLAETYP